ncbi:MAG: carboxypeptidase-like regulatory domain-containing protein, partial [Planctomycetota bacterium]
MAIEGSPGARDTVRIAFDDRPPTVAATLRKRTIISGASPTVRLMVSAVDLSGVSRVLVWQFAPRDLPKSEAELDPGAVALDYSPARQTALLLDERGVRRIPIDLPAPVEPGRYLIVVEVSDESGQTASTLRNPQELVVRPPRPSPEELGPLVADLTGKVLYATGRPASGVRVAIKEKPRHAAQSNGAGDFKIPRVEAGTYTLVVQGTVNGRPVVGELEVALEERADFAGVVVPAEWQLSKKEDE